MSITGTISAVTGQKRLEQLHAIARGYVTEGLGKKNFDAIPYHDEVELRAPLCPGGSATPLVGREALRTVWWPPLPALIERVQVLDSFVNQDLSAAAVEFHLTLSEPRCTLRIFDRFTIDAAGEIMAQENYFDPRPLTNPSPAAADGGRDMAVNIQTTGVHHIALRSSHLDRSRRFYVETLGFAPILEASNLFIFVAGSTAVAVRGPEADTPQSDFFNPFRVGLDHVALACADEQELARVAQALETAGVPNTGIKRDQTLGKLYVAFKDPDRIAWELYMV